MICETGARRAPHDAPYIFRQPDNYLLVSHIGFVTMKFKDRLSLERYRFIILWENLSNQVSGDINNFAATAMLCKNYVNGNYQTNWQIII